MKESAAFKKAKARNSAYIIKGEWIVRVMADGTIIPIKYVGKTQVKVNKSKRIIKL